MTAPTETKTPAERATAFVSNALNNFTVRLRAAVNTRTAMLPEFLVSTTKLDDIAFTVTLEITCVGCVRSREDRQPASSDSVRITCRTDNRDLAMALATYYGSTVVDDGDSYKVSLPADDLLVLVAAYSSMLRGLTPAYQPSVTTYPTAPSDAIPPDAPVNLGPPARPTEIWANQFPPDRPTDMPRSATPPYGPNDPVDPVDPRRELVGTGV